MPRRPVGRASAVGRRACRAVGPPCSRVLVAILRSLDSRLLSTKHDGSGTWELFAFLTVIFPTLLLWSGYPARASAVTYELFLPATRREYLKELGAAAALSQFQAWAVMSCRNDAVVACCRTGGDSSRRICECPDHLRPVAVLAVRCRGLVLSSSVPEESRLLLVVSFWFGFCLFSIAWRSRGQ